MKSLSISIRNYKSLKRVHFAPKSFSVLLGPNAAGKSNIADAMDFLSYVYRHGLEYAVARKGGYENIAFRQQRRTKDAISFDVKVVLEVDPRRLFLRPSQKALVRTKSVLVAFHHQFSFRAYGQGIKSEFKVIKELVEYSLEIQEKDLFNETNGFELQITRSSDGKIGVQTSGGPELKAGLLVPELQLTDGVEYQVEPFELAATSVLIPPRLMRPFLAALSQIAVFRFSSDISRSAGVPTPNPTLSTKGENLPAVVDWLKRKRADRWTLVMSAMRDMVPGLEDIDVQYLHTKTLGVVFKEKNVGRSWSAEDVSDGTIRMLAILVASVDPRSSMLLIEEPEIAVHPWMLKLLVDRLQEISKEKIVIITSHSPSVLDRVDPHSVWLVFKRGGQTQLAALTELDPEVSEHWLDGRYRISEYLDSGALAEFVPGGMS